MTRSGWTWSILTACIMFASEGLPVPTAWAQGGSLKAVFEKHNLLGVFAMNCDQPPSKNNLYYVHRLIDADHVQREQMSGPTTRDWVIIIDGAEERGPNQIFFRGQRDQLRGEGGWRIEQNRLQLVEGSLGGQKLVAGGKILASGRSMPWYYRCKSAVR